MHTLTFDDKERNLVIEILEADLQGLLHEIHHTDNREYREMLQGKKSSLEQFLKRLQEA
jgi:hypothetical protein